MGDVNNMKPLEKQQITKLEDLTEGEVAGSNGGHNSSMTLDSYYGNKSSAEAG